jgi:hypothetical protein
MVDVEELNHDSAGGEAGFRKGLVDNASRTQVVILGWQRR